ncbi:hypothetical protein CQA53_03450 [Helicobacter didelphidarum]|uniref:Uncharacterized protein n=2 Tax=Helicobacter didelphidarum TaxID=2040648 RepID=A0A3D8IPH9_9HELI|nr:hypothetical protein CQA53_03450 [Helicobacter didelphidarum]
MSQNDKVTSRHCEERSNEAIHKEDSTYNQISKILQKILMDCHALISSRLAIMKQYQVSLQKLAMTIRIWEFSTLPYIIISNIFPSFTLSFSTPSIAIIKYFLQNICLWLYAILLFSQGENYDKTRTFQRARGYFNA